MNLIQYFNECVILDPGLGFLETSSSNHLFLMTQRWFKLGFSCGPHLIQIVAVVIEACIKVANGSVIPKVGGGPPFWDTLKHKENIDVSI